MVLVTHTVPVCYDSFDLFPEIGILIPGLAMTVWWMYTLRVIYNWFPRGILYYFVNLAVYYISFVVSDYGTQSLKPFQDCVFVSPVLGTSRYGLPSADLAYVISILFANIMLFGSVANLRLVLTNLIASLFVTFFYWWAYQLTILQAIFTLGWAVALTWILIKFTDLLYAYFVKFMPFESWWRQDSVEYVVVYAKDVQPSAVPSKSTPKGTLRHCRKEKK